MKKDEDRAESGKIEFIRVHIIRNSVPWLYGRLGIGFDICLALGWGFEINISLFIVDISIILYNEKRGEGEW